MRWFLPVFASFLSLAILGVVQRKAINFLLMGFFRDVGRIKARNRRMRTNSNAVASNLDILLRRDDPLEGVDFESEVPGAADRTSYTLTELSEYGDGRDGRPLLLSVFGRVYDVSAGERFYGEGGSYHMFAGRDITRALCTGCKDDSCLTRDTGGLTESQLAEGKRWLSFFQMHDKYSYVGNLEGDREGWLDALVESGLRETADGPSGEGELLNGEAEGATVEL